MNTLSMALASICMSVAAQFSFRHGMAHLKASAPGQLGAWQELLRVAACPSVLAGFALYGAAAVVWLKVLSEWEVSKAYPLAGLGFALSAGIGFISGESVSVMRLVGAAMICLGVLVIGRS